MSDGTPSRKTGTLFWLPVILDDERLDPVETLLLVGLADHVDDQDEGFVGIDRLAKRARCSYPTAKRRMASLTERGAVERHRKRRDDGNLSVYSYRLSRTFFALQGINLIPDQGSSGRAMTRDHPGDPAEPPRTEPPRTDGGSTSSPRPKSRKTTLPGGWAPTDQHRFLARAEGVDCEREAAKFRDHAIAKRSTYVDWDAAFRTWLRKAGEWAGPRRDVSDDGFRAVWDA